MFDKVGLALRALVDKNPAIYTPLIEMVTYKEVVS